MISPLTVIDVQQETREIKSYKNVPLSLINDHVIRLSVMTELFYWHYHPDSDETLRLNLPLWRPLNAS
jgi:hypothetical protein